MRASWSSQAESHFTVAMTSIKVMVPSMGGKKAMIIALQFSEMLASCCQELLNTKRRCTESKMKFNVM